MLFKTLFRVSVSIAVAASTITAAQSLYSTAILPFSERGRGVQGLGSQVSDIMFGQLSAHPELMLVERAELDKIMQEVELNLSGVMSSEQAIQVGKLTGARLLISGSAMEVGDRGQIYLIAKIIGTETSRVQGASVKGNLDDGIATLAEQLAEQVATIISAKAQSLLPEIISQDDQLAQLNKLLGDRQRPSLLIKVKEQHIGDRTIDPAAETELAVFAEACGFALIDSAQGRSKDAQVLIVGEGFSEFAGRRGNLISVKARLEVKAIDPVTDQVLAVDRQTTVVVDSAEQLAGKKALQQAAAAIALRMLPKLARN